MELRELSGELRVFNKALHLAVAVRTTSAIRDELATRIPQRTPVGATGKHKAGWRRIPGRPFEPTLIGSGRAMAILEAGRGRGRSGKLRGSRQAPRGMVKPELDALRARGDRHIENHVGRVFR